MELYVILDYIRLGSEALAALVGLIYLPRLKNSYWKWFAVYLILIFIQEMFWFNRNSFQGLTDNDFFAFFGIPVQMLFFYWLYALKSLKNKRLFFICCLLYLITLPLELYFEKTDQLYSVNVQIGVLILTFLIVKEFIKQIKTDAILKFKTNKMFYVNTGVVLFYLGTYPFHALYEPMRKGHKELLYGYYLFFLISCTLMYLLFAASFIWGKKES